MVITRDEALVNTAFEVGLIVIVSWLLLVANILDEILVDFRTITAVLVNKLLDFFTSDLIGVVIETWEGLVDGFVVIKVKEDVL